MLKNSINGYLINFKASILLSTINVKSRKHLPIIFGHPSFEFVHDIFLCVFFCFCFVFFAFPLILSVIFVTHRDDKQGSYSKALMEAF